MEFSLDTEEHKTLKVCLTRDQVRMEFKSTFCDFSFHPLACQRLMTSRDIITEKFHKLKHDFNISYIQRLYKNLYVVVQYPFKCI